MTQPTLTIYQARRLEGGLGVWGCFDVKVRLKDRAVIVVVIAYCFLVLSPFDVIVIFKGKDNKHFPLGRVGKRFRRTLIMLDNNGQASPNGLHVHFPQWPLHLSLKMEVGNACVLSLLWRVVPTVKCIIKCLRQIVCMQATCDYGTRIRTKTKKEIHVYRVPE